MKQRKKAPEGGADWMGTYGDMVTLLLCFFVLLYSISSVDQVKWENLVRSFNPDAEEVSQLVIDANLEAGDEDVPGSFEAEEVTEQFDKLYKDLQNMQTEYSEVVDIELESGEGYQFIRFNDTVFFGGDSSELLPVGREILAVFSGIIKESESSIQQMSVLGHTTLADPNRPNEVAFDRILSAERAAVVTAYIQTFAEMPGEKLVSVGYGQFRPVAPFDTEENRAKNRRVEILITKSGTVEQSLEKYYDEAYANLAQSDVNP